MKLELRISITVLRLLMAILNRVGGTSIQQSMDPKSEDGILRGTGALIKDIELQAAVDKRLETVTDRACPCHHLKEPCQPNCTCVNPTSSAGCAYCCTYGSNQQQQAKAKIIAGAVVRFCTEVEFDKELAASVKEAEDWLKRRHS